MCNIKKNASKFQETVYDEKKCVNLHRILFNLFVLTVNLNLYCSSEARELRANRLYCIYLTSTNYGIVAFAQDEAV